MEPQSVSTTGRLPLAALAALAVSAFSMLLTEMMPAALLPGMSAALHQSGAAVGILVSVCAAASTAAAIPLVAMTRSVPRRTLFVVLLAGFVLANGTLAVAPSYRLIIVSRVATGLCMGALWPVVAGYAWHLGRLGNPGRSVAIALSGSTIALAFGLPSASAIGSVIGWRVMFGLLSVLFLVLIMWVLWKLPPVQGERIGERVSLVEVAMRPGFPTVLMTTLLIAIGHYTLYTYMAPLAAALGVPGGTPTAMLIFGVGAMTGIWIVGRTVDEHLRRTAWGGLALTVCAMVSLRLLEHASIGEELTIYCWGIAFGGVPTFFQTATNKAAGPPADVAASLLSTVYGFGIFGGSALGGILLKPVGVLNLPLITVAMVILAGVLIRSGHRRAFPHPP
ncbi:MAG TPA: MFS transporter [Acidisoma sp.]|nr:MFS transporter [Acidisoma sp.]